MIFQKGQKRLYIKNTQLKHKECYDQKVTQSTNTKTTPKTIGCPNQSTNNLN